MKHFNVLDLIRLVALFENGFVDFERLLRKCDNSPGKKLLKLWQHIHSCKGKYADTKEDRIEAHKVVYGQKTLYNPKKMQTSMSQLRFYLVAFIKDNLMDDSALGQFIQASAFRELGHEKLEYGALDLAIAETQGQMTPTASLVCFLANRRKYLIEKRTAETSNVSLVEIEKTLDLLYFENKLRNAIDIVSTWRCTGQALDKAYLKELKRFLEFLPDKISPLAEVQTYVIKYYLAPSPEAYKELKEIYFSQFDALGAEKGGLLIDLISSLTIIPNLSLELRKEYLELYKFGLSNNLLVEDGKISSLRYDNMIFCAEFIGDYAFIKQIVEEELGELIENKKDKKRSLLLSKSYMLFGEGKYDEAIENLRTLGRAKEVPHYFIRRKHLLMLKCLYELKEYSADVLVTIKNEGDSFYEMLDEHLKKNFIDSSTYNSYTNFYRFLCEIADKSNPTNTKTVLKEKIESFEGHLVQLKWLMNKATAAPIWNCLYEFKNIYDTTSRKYDALELLKEMESGFKRKLSRYCSNGYINRNSKQSCLNFYNILCRICDERNPRNSRRHLEKLLGSYNGVVVEWQWLNEKIKKTKK